jgi:transcriptional regulator
MYISISEPWALQDAPADFIEKMIGGIVGIEVAIDYSEHLFSVSQTCSYSLSEEK